MTGEQIDMDFIMGVLSVTCFPLGSFLYAYNWYLFLDLICVESISLTI